jgi:transcriptional regulator with XRE-family HTH domain
MQIRGKAAKDVGLALWQALTGRAYSTHEKQAADTAAATEAMIEKWGSTRAVADRVGVDIRTVQRWRNGEQNPGKANREKFDAAFRETKVTPGRKAQMAGGGSASGPAPEQRGTGGLAIYGTIRVSEDERERWINPGSRMTPDEADSIIDAMIQHGPQAAADALNAIVGRYVPTMRVIEIQEIDY